MGIAIEEIENEIINLPQDQLRKFRAWYEAFDSNAWDEQIEHDVVTGKLNALANAAIIVQKKVVIRHPFLYYHSNNIQYPE